MGFTLGVASKIKRLFLSWPNKEKGSEECNIVSPRRGSDVTDFGTKDETFFDTRVWLDSDCEDDYYSVKGDFSRGSTPNRLFVSIGTPPRNGEAFAVNAFPDPRSEPSPTDKKKLAELLQISLREQGSNVLKPDDGINSRKDIEDAETIRPQSSSEGAPKPKKERSGLTASCCLPGLVPGISSRKQKLSPAR